MSACSSCNVSAINITRKNSVNLILHLQTNGAAITSLGSAIEARFVAVNADGDIIIDKSLGSGVTLDTPEQGDVTVELTSTDTDVEFGRYDIAFKAVWGPANQLEWNFPIPLVIEEGVVP